MSFLESVVGKFVVGRMSRRPSNAHAAWNSGALPCDELVVTLQFEEFSRGLSQLDAIELDVRDRSSRRRDDSSA
jgi:hypothetical protein